MKLEDTIALLLPSRSPDETRKQIHKYVSLIKYDQVLFGISKECTENTASREMAEGRAKLLKGFEQNH